MAPLVSLLVDQGVIEPRAFHQNACFDASVLFARTEGTIPAPETSHAIKAVIDEALKCKEKNEEKCIAFLFSGHGHFDLASYDAYLSGDLKDFDLPEEDIQKALDNVPRF
jgi:tryptophan synthase beta chain